VSFTRQSCTGGTLIHATSLWNWTCNWFREWELQTAFRQILVPKIGRFSRQDERLSRPLDEPCHVHMGGQCAGFYLMLRSKNTRAVFILLYGVATMRKPMLGIHRSNGRSDLGQRTLQRLAGPGLGLHVILYRQSTHDVIRRWREIRACNDNVCGESKSQNSHESLLDLTFLLAATDPKVSIY
jgi:hypothetical protein